MLTLYEIIASVQQAQGSH